MLQTASSKNLGGVKKPSLSDVPLSSETRGNDWMSGTTSRKGGESLLGAGAIWKDIMLIIFDKNLFDIVVCVQLHINYIYGSCTNVL